MAAEIWVAIISLIGTLGGTLGGILISNRLTVYRIAQLEEKVNKHNNLIDRTYKLEARMTEAEREMTEMKEEQKEQKANFNRVHPPTN